MYYRMAAHHSRMQPDWPALLISDPGVPQPISSGSSYQRTLSPTRSPSFQRRDLGSVSMPDHISCSPVSARSYCSLLSGRSDRSSRTRATSINTTWRERYRCRQHWTFRGSWGEHCVGPYARSVVAQLDRPAAAAGRRAQARRALPGVVCVMELLVAPVVPRHPAVAEHSEHNNRNQAADPSGSKCHRDNQDSKTSGNSQGSTAVIKGRVSFTRRSLAHRSRTFKQRSDRTS